MAVHMRAAEPPAGGRREQVGRVGPGQLGPAARRRPHLCCQVVGRHGTAHSHHVGQGLRQAGDDARLKNAEGVAQVTAGAAVLLPALKVKDLQADRQAGRGESEGETGGPVVYT